jgi:fructose-1,6-bisphosphatase I
MSEKSEKIKLSRWLEKNIQNDFPAKEDLVDIVETIAEATIPIRGLLERGITSREIEQRMNIVKPGKDSKNIYNEKQIHEDLLTHSIIFKTLQEADTDLAFIASEESPPSLGNGVFGITTDPVDGSSNVAVNRTVGTIVGIFNEKGKIICGFYVLYGIFTNLVIAIDGKVAEFILDTVPYSTTFYHYVFQNYVSMPDEEKGGIRCLGGDPTKWPKKCKTYEKNLIRRHLRDRYSGSFVGDFHAITHYGGVYAYFPSPKGKIRLYYEWLPLAFIAKTLGGEFFKLGEESHLDEIKTIEEIQPLTKENINEIHMTTCGGIIGSRKLVNLFL